MQLSPKSWTKLFGSLGLKEQRKRRKGIRKRPQRTRQFEPLEPRQMMAGDFSVNDVVVVETDNAAQFIVTRSSGAGAATVHYQTADGTALQGTDYTASSGTLTFPEGVTSLPLSIPLGSELDRKPEIFETFSVKLTQPVNAGIADGEGTAHIRDDDNIIVAGPDAQAGHAPRVFVYDSLTGAEKYSFLAYPSTVDDGVRVAVGHFDNDGVPDIVTAAGSGNTGEIRVFSGAALAANAGNASYLDNPPVMLDFLAYPTFQGGLYVATGDLNGDGIDDVITGPGEGGGPHVKAFSGANGDMLWQGITYNSIFTGGVRVASADINGDGRDDIITAPGPTGSPHIRAFDAVTGQVLADFYAYETDYTGGIYVAAVDTTGDGVAEIFTGPGSGRQGGTEVRELDRFGVVRRAFNAYGPGVSLAVRVAAGDVDGDGSAELITAPGAPGGAHVRAFDLDTLAVERDFFALESGFVSGVFVGGDEHLGMAPSITSIADTSTNEDTATSQFSFTIADGDTSASALSVVASSSNPALVPVGNITIQGTGAQQQVSVSPAPNQVGSAVIFVTVSDGIRSATELFEVNVTPVNDRPIATSATRYLAAATRLSLAGEDGDPETAQAMSYALVGPPTSGTITDFDPATGEFTYTPQPGFSGTVAIPFSVTDDSTAGGAAQTSDPATLTLHVGSGLFLEPIGDQATREGETLIFRAVGHHPNPQQSLNYSIQWPNGAPAPVSFDDDQNVSFGALHGVFAWAPGENEGGKSYTAIITVSDGQSSASETITIDIGERNQKPVVTDNVSATEWQSIFFDGNTPSEQFVQVHIDAQDHDLPAQNLTVTIDPVPGATYQPTYDSNTGQVLWTVHEADAGKIYELIVRVSDSFSPEAGESLLYVPVGVTDTRVGPERPIAIPDTFSAPHGQPIQAIYGVFGNDYHLIDGTDVETVVELVEGQGVEHGTLDIDLVTSQFTYTPHDPLFVGEDSFSYKLKRTTDFNGVETVVYSNVVTVRLELTNKAPAAQDDSDYTFDEDGVLNVSAALGVRANDSDVEGDPTTVTEVLATAHGRLSLSSDGSFSYEPNPDFAGLDSFVYRLDDGLPTLLGFPFDPGASSDRAQYGIVTITVNAVNDPPRAVDDEYAVVEGELLSIEPAGILGNDTDPESNSLSVAYYDATSASGAVIAVNQDGGFSYDPRGVSSLSNLPSGTSVVDSFSYTISDGYATDTATVYVTVHATPNAAPHASDDAYAYSIVDGESLAIAAAGVLVNDTDANQDPLTAILVSDASNGTVSLASDGSFTYTRNPGFFGRDSFTYKANDGDDDSNVATVVIDVIGMYDPQTNDPDVPLGGTCNCGCGCGTSAKPDKQTGGLKVDLPMGDDPLVYLSNANPHPVIAVETVFSTSNTLVPDAVEASLTFGGVVGQTVFYSTVGLDAGDALRFPLQVDATSLPTGRYEYAVTLTNTYGTRQVSQTIRGFQTVVNLTQSEFGNRWSLAGLDRLVVQPASGGALLVGGNGMALWYQAMGGGQFAASAGDPEFARLVENGDGSYTLTSKDGSRREFDSTGLLTARVDANENVTQYNYTDADGDTIEDEISQIVDPFGRTRGFAYTAGRLTTVTDTAGRATTIAYHPDGTLASVTSPDPDGPLGPLAAPVQTFGYDATTRLMTSWTNAMSQTTQFAHDAALRLVQVQHPDNRVESLDAVQTQGWVDTASGTGSQGNPVPMFYTEAIGTETHHGQTSSFTTDRFGFLTRTVDALGTQILYERDANGLVTRMTEPDPDGAGPLGDLVTEYTYDLRGNLLTTLLPSGATRSSTYVSIFSRMTSSTDELGRVTLYDIDAHGNLLSTTRVVGQVDSVLNGETNDVRTSYTYTDGSTALPAGLLLTETDPLGRVTVYAYYSDPQSVQFGRLQSITYAQGTLDEATYQYEYDAAGNRTAELDPLGRRTDYEYDALDRLVKATLPDPDGAGLQTRPVMTTTYDAEGNVLTETDALNRVTQYEYEFGRLVERTDPDPDGTGPLTAPVTSYAYHHGLLETVTDPLGRVTSYGYDELDRLVTTTLPDPDGAGPLTSPIYTTVYDILGNVLSETDPLNKTTTYSYDELGRVLTVTDAMSGVTTYVYNAAGQTTSVIDALGRVTNYGYDDLGRLTTTTLADPDGSGPLSRPVYTTNYDKAGNVTSEIDPLGNLTGYEYDALNRRTKVIAADPDGSGTLPSPIYSTTYDAAGNVLTETDPLLRVTSYQYDDLNRLIKTTLPDPDGDGPLASPKHWTAYDAVGNVVSQTDPLGKVTSYVYDDLNRLITLTQPDPDGDGLLASPVTTYVYDAASQLTSVTDPLARLTQYEYDDLGRQIKRIEPDPDAGGPLTSPEHLTAYDAVGNVLSQTDPLGQVTQFGYDDLNRRTSVTDALAGVTSYTFDAVGNLLSLTDPELNTTTWVYDGLNRVTTETNALMAVRSFEYDAVGNLTERTDRNGRVIKYFYDDLYRLTQEQWLDGQTVVRSISSTFDAASQLSQISDPSATYGYQYDRLGRTNLIVQQLAGLGSAITLSQEFDDLSRRTSLRAKIGTSLDYVNAYQFDGLSRLTRITQQGQSGGSAVADKRIDLAYNAASQFTGITRYHDLAGTQIVVTTGYVYDPLGRLTDLTHAQGGRTMSGYAWTYDQLSRVIQFTSLLDGVVDYSYDDTNQLTTADQWSGTDENYSYDANGNRTNPGYSTGDNNQLLSDGTYNYTYDGEGNRLTQTTIATGEVKEYDWDHRNRLVGITYLTAAGGTVTKRVAYEYDVFNRRIAKDVDETGDGTFDRGERYVYDGEHVALVFDHTGALLHRFVHNPQVIDQILADEQFEPVSAGEMPTAAGNVIWPLADNQGTIRDLAEYDETLGITDIANHRVYDSFGQIISETDPTIHHQFGFTGRDWDADAGMYYYRARWYDPVVGRFIAEDPISFTAGDANINRYVGNNPLNGTDPSGLFKVNYIPGRVKLISAKIAPSKSQTLSSAFDVAWSVNNAAFWKNVNGKQCKLCDEIGIFQIVKGSGTQTWSGVPLPGTMVNLNYSWQVDTIDSDPAYGQASDPLGGVVRGDPTKISVISAEDLPGINPKAPIWYAASVKQYSMKAETYVVCLSGEEGIKKSDAPLNTRMMIDSITVYAGVAWEHSFTLGDDGKWTATRRITSRDAVPSKNFEEALWRRYGIKETR